jgi:hypothetical protein
VRKNFALLQKKANKINFKASMNDKTGHLVFEYEMPSKFTEDLVKRVQNGNPAF